MCASWIDRFSCPEELGGLPLQVIALPWVSYSGLIAALVRNPSSDRRLTNNSSTG